MADWKCQECTLLNDNANDRCDGCGYERSLARTTNGGDDRNGSELEFTYPDRDQADDATSGRYGVLNNEMRIVLLGRTGSGKSATGNTILGKEHFKAAVSGSSVTANSSRGESTRGDRTVLVVDTPGLFDTNRLNFEITMEIAKCVGMISPGPHAVLLVIGIGRFTKEEQDTVDHFLQHFGSEVIKYMIIIFTREDSLKQENKTIDEFVDEAPEELKELVKNCGNRYVALNNTASSSEREAKVNEIFKKIDAMVEQNNGVCYTNEMFQEAEAVLRRRMDQIRAEFEQEERSRRQSIERQVSGNFEKDLNKLRKERDQLEKKMKTMQNDSDSRQKEQHLLQVEIAKLKKQRDASLGGANDERNCELSVRIAELTKKQILLRQQLQQSDRQRLLLAADLDKNKHYLNNSRRQNNTDRPRGAVKLDDKTVRHKVRDDVEHNSSSNVFTELVDSLKRIGTTFLSKAIQFFTKIF